MGEKIRKKACIKDLSFPWKHWLMKSSMNEVSCPLNIRFHYLVDGRLLKGDILPLLAPLGHKCFMPLQWSRMQMPWVTESLDRVKHCAGQMCCQERAFAEKRDSCPQDGVGVGGGRGVKQEERKYAREGDPTTWSQPLEPPAGKLHQLASSSGSSRAGQTSGLCSN